MEPTRPITLHQKALFCFWISVIALWILLRAIRHFKKWRDKGESKPDGDTAESDVETGRKTLIRLIQYHIYVV